jgi:pilus assembly protein CpaB
MNRQAILFLGVALALGLVAALLAQRWLQGQLPQVAAGPADTVPVAVARIDIPIGSPLTSSQLDSVKWPRAYAPKGSFSDPGKASGRVVRRPIAAGEPLLETALHPQGAEAGLVSVIENGKRAVSVKVDAVIGVAGFIKPGSHVDVLATIRRIDRQEALPYTNSVLQDVRVLAIDQRLEQVGDADPKLVNVVTLEVDPAQAPRLTYIAHEGRLQLALRGPGDRELSETQSVAVADVMPLPRRPQARRAAGPSVQMIKGTSLSTRRF